MLTKFLKKVFGDKQDRDMKRIWPLVDTINEVYKEYEEISDEDLKNKTQEFRKLLGVVPRVVRAGEGKVYIGLEQAEQFLQRHPDVEKAVFVGSRRDFHAGDLYGFIKVKEGKEGSEDLANQLSQGMARLNDEHIPKAIIFIDEFPKAGKEIDYNKLVCIVESNEYDKYKKATLEELLATVKDESEQITLDDLLPEAFAAIKETCRRFCGKKWSAAGTEIEWNMVPFDVQLAGGVSLHEGNISEMATGEGKTLTAILPTYLNALTAKGVHVVTVNDYLAKRDSEWMNPVFEHLGLSVGCIDKTDPGSPHRRIAYRCDITYGTNNEFGFDYLRDNMVQDKNRLVQRPHFFCIIDEVDSVLIDEARTPLIIAGPVDRSNKQYTKLVPMIREIVNKQQVLVSKTAKEAEELLESDPESWEGGLNLLMCEKGMPKHNRYMKLRENAANQRLTQSVEAELMRSKSLRELEEKLFFVVEEKNHQISLTEQGREALNPKDPEYFVLPDLVDELAKIEEPYKDKELTDEERKAIEEKKLQVRQSYEDKAEELHSISQLLTAFVLKKRDVDYVVEYDEGGENGKIVIVDENTGRKMAGRRWSDGLHGAVEAKENVKIEKETQTLASITIQNYFRLYEKLSGMTGTAETEAGEFNHIYDMDVVVVPTNVECQRADLNDILFKTEREKYAAIIEEIERIHKMEKPILVGTTSVAKSEKLSRMLRSKKLPHKVLNAKNHAQEAEIISEAGRPGAITIATNMAGRGTDIKLKEGVTDSAKDESGEEWMGGLQIIGTERHESRRIDRQLRGRAGRQGDPGTSRFFVSLEDDLMRWFGESSMAKMLQKYALQEGEPIEHRFMTNAIESAQKKIEQINQERRKRTLEYDDVMNKQRETVYKLRRELLMEDDLREVILDIFADALDNEFLAEYGEPENANNWDLEGFFDWVAGVLMKSEIRDLSEEKFEDYDQLINRTMEFVVDAYEEKCEQLEPNDPNNFSRVVALSTLDSEWQDHLLGIDSLREGIGLRGYGQKEPLLEFTSDATEMFSQLLLTVHKEIFDRFFRYQVISKEEQERRRKMMEQMQAAHPDANGEVQEEQQKPKKPAKPKSGVEPYRREKPKMAKK